MAPTTEEEKERGPAWAGRPDRSYFVIAGVRAGSSCTARVFVR